MALEILVNTGPCVTTAIWRCRNPFSQWQRSFQRKLRSHWLKLLRQRHVAVVRQGPRSGNGLLPDGTKPLPEPMLTYHQWGPVTFICGYFQHHIKISQGPMNGSKRDWHNSLVPGDVEVILHAYFSNAFYDLISEARPTKLVVGECHRTSLKISQHRLG